MKMIRKTGRINQLIAAAVDLALLGIGAGIPAWARTILR